MINVNSINPEIIKKIFIDNYFFIHQKLLLHQSKYISNLYDHYFKDIESAGIVLYFEKLLHQSIIQKKEFDLNQDISLDNFWINHSDYIQNKIKIINISLNSVLPKETARRKIKKLIKFKVLKEKNKIIFLNISELNKINYNNITEKNISLLSTLIKNILDYTDSTKTLDQIEMLIKNNYSFYWYHYLNTQQNYLKIWQKKLKDLELLLIAIECSIHGTYYLLKKKKIDKTFVDISNNEERNYFSASTISLTTKIPRATCIRKLSKLIKFKLIKKDDILRKYYFDFNNYGKCIFNLKSNNFKIIDLYSNFFYLVIRALNKGG